MAVAVLVTFLAVVAKDLTGSIKNKEGQLGFIV